MFNFKRAILDRRQSLQSQLQRGCKSDLCCCLWDKVELIRQIGNNHFFSAHRTRDGMFFFPLESSLWGCEHKRVVINKLGSVLVDSRVSGLLMVSKYFMAPLAATSIVARLAFTLTKEKKSPNAPFGWKWLNKTVIVRKFHFNWGLKKKKKKKKNLSHVVDGSFSASSPPTPPISLVL